MSIIHVLPDILVKKIAAGEVIERPASVIKEIMENAIDAGATRVSVHVEDGGKALMRVSDDGCGMLADDLRLAITPHATSKLAEEEDLYHIGSLGFRGEALASIGSISRVTIRSRPHEISEGAEIVVEAEEVHANRAAGCPAGTTVEVRDLFFNVPARRKFLRNSGTEFGHINTQFARIALAHPDVGFELHNNGKSVHNLPAGQSPVERISRFYSRELGDDMIAFERRTEGIEIVGFAGQPSGARSSGNWQFSFLNRRFIRDKFIQHAIKEAYRGLIDPRRFPVVFLFISVNPATVDVNVHPTKMEVRWQDSGTIHREVLSSLREALGSADLTPTFDPQSTSRPPVDPAQQDAIRRQFADQFKSMTPSQPSLAFGPDAQARSGSTSRPPMHPSSGNPAQGMDMWEQVYGQRDASHDPDQTIAAMDQPYAVAGPDVVIPHSVKGAIQLHNTYLVCETDEGMMIIDQHALHERIMFEQLRDRMTRGPLESQRLLLPETLSVSASALAVLESEPELLNRLGFEVSRFGSDAVALQAIPSILRDRDATEFFRDFLDRLSSKTGDEPAESFIYDILSMMACKAAVKAGDPLTPEEIESLLAQKDLVEKSSNCPHGRPTTLRLTVRDLERQFKRT